MIDWICNQLFGPPAKADGRGKRKFTHWIDSKGNTFAFDSTQLSDGEERPINTDTASYWVDADGKVQCSINGVPGWIDESGEIHSAFDTKEAPSLDGVQLVSDEQAIRNGFVPVGWTKTPIQVEPDQKQVQQSVSVTVSVSVDAYMTTTTVTGIKYDQLSETIDKILQRKEEEPKS